MNLLMVSSDNSIVEGRKGSFFNLLKEFSKYWSRIDILCPRVKGFNGSTLTILGNVDFHPSKSSKPLHPLFIMRKGHELSRQRKYSLMVSHDFGLQYNGIGTWLLWRKTRIPYISEIHHITGYPKAANIEEKLRRYITETYIRWVWKRAIAIRVVNSVELPNKLMELGVPREKILTLYSLYIDFNVFRPMNLPKIYDVAFVGRFDHNKGVFLILDAISEVKRGLPDVKLVVVGRGKLKNKFFKKASELDLLGNITYFEWLPHAEGVAEVYNQSKILLCASFNEGGPRVTVEAMACGTPVISTPVGVMKELLKDGENGYLFHWNQKELFHKILTLLKDENLRRSLGERGRHSVQCFKYEEVIKNYALTYRELAQKSESISKHKTECV